MLIGVPAESAGCPERRGGGGAGGRSQARGARRRVTLAAGAWRLGADRSLTSLYAHGGGREVADARSLSVECSRLVVKVAPPSADEAALMERGSVIVGFSAIRWAVLCRDTRARRCRRDRVRDGGDPADLALVPQSMDAALVAESNVAGLSFHARLCWGPSTSGRFFPMLMTAAGAIPAGARAGARRRVSPGLQALATARRLGAQTTRLRRASGGRRAGPLARRRLAGSPASRQLWRGRLCARARPDAEKASSSNRRSTDAIKGFDVVITTALVPGRAAPLKLVTAEAVRGHARRQR